VWEKDKTAQHVKAEWNVSGNNYLHPLDHSTILNRQKTFQKKIYMFCSKHPEDEHIDFEKFCLQKRHESSCMYQEKAAAQKEIIPLYLLSKYTLKHLFMFD
jgi:hypothetical protein